MSHVTLKDGRGVRLGRLRPKARPQALRFAAYFDPRKDRQPPPASVDYAQKAMAAIQRMYLNDQYGDCVIAGKYHQVGIWSGNDTGTAQQGSDNEVYQMYQTICGRGDNGCYITDVLDYFRDRGLPLSGKLHKIDGYVSVDNTNKLEVQVAIDLFGSLTLGIDLPNDWTCTNCTWDVTNSRIVGGHDVCVCGYNAQGVQICTWGGIVTITWSAFTSSKWITECYAQLSPDWYNDDQLAPNGIDVATLKADLAKLGGGVIPDIDPPTPPGPPPPPPPPPPSPPPPPNQQFNINVPQQPVMIGSFPIGHVPAFTVQGTLGAHAAGPFELRIPPWLLTLLKMACAGTIILPPPWSFILQALCGALPADAYDRAAGGEHVAVTLPPWAIALLKMFCSEALLLPTPFNQLFAGLCGLLPQKTPCGCQ